MTRCMRSNTVRAASRGSASMANYSVGTEALAAAPGNSPRHGDLLWTRKGESTSATRETAGSWRCKWNETLDAHHRFRARIDVDRLFARRDVPSLANAIFYAGCVSAGGPRTDCGCALRPRAWRW